MQAPTLPAYLKEITALSDFDSLELVMSRVGLEAWENVGDMTARYCDENWIVERRRTFADEAKPSLVRMAVIRDRNVGVSFLYLSGLHH